MVYFMGTYMYEKRKFGVMHINSSGPSPVNEGQDRGRDGGGMLAVLKMLRSINLHVGCILWLTLENFFR